MEKKTTGKTMIKKPGFPEKKRENNHGAAAKVHSEKMRYKNADEIYE